MSEPMDRRQLEQDALKHIIPHFASYEMMLKEPKIFVKGEGCYLFDVDGKRYLDTFASLLTTICGHHQPSVDNAIRAQLDELEFFPNYVDTFTVPLIRLAKKIAELMPGELGVSFFVNSGSEANETALKMARQYHLERGETARWKVIYRRHSYHGTTLGGSSATGLQWFREHFEPLLPGYISAPTARCFGCEFGLVPETCGLRCLKAMEEQIKWEVPERISALIMDPIPGSNIGFPVPPDGYIQGVRELCDRYGILLIFDEVQTGFGKTGKMFACEHWGVTPDIITIGKGFSGGYVPLGATVTTEKVYSVFRRPGHELRSGSTYGGHTIACAATLANIAVIEDNGLVENARLMGEYLRGKLQSLRGAHRIVGHVSGIGLLQAQFLAVDPKLAVGSFIRDYCYANGMIMRNNGNILVFAPALIITRAQIDDIMRILDAALGEAERKFGL
jgi:adenosylmethionine-8-amino-7-oxononanoate aminotransferase